MSCRAVVAITFAYSAATKVSGRTAFADFRGWLTSAAGVPLGVAAPVAAAMVALEATAALAMLVPALVGTGFAVSVLLLAVFSAGIRSMITRRVSVPCRCFGTARRPPGPAHLARNLILLAIAATGGLMTAAGTGPAPLDGASLLAVVAGTTAALLLINLDEIVALYHL